MSNTTIYISSKDQKLKDWTDLFCKNLSMISTQFFGSNETIEVVSFEGKLSTADKHIFILSDDTTISNIEVSSNNLFQVHLTPISFNNIPSFLYQAPLFEFFNTDLTHNTSTWIDLDVSTGNSWEKLLDFTKRIFNIYKKDKQIIYLAKTSLNQIANRDLLKRDLLNQGFNVIPEHPLNDSSADILKEQIDTLIKDASLSIHIYGNDSSKELNQDFEIVEFQNKLCAKSANTNLQRLIWLPSDVRLDKENEEKISILRKDLEMLKGAEFVEAPLELFKSLVYQKIENISELNKDKKSGLYLIYD
ncbi:hypothetical protein N9242_07635, partial [Vicingaceae bacterium]|nr:hypothetical protein [Vicingaceae bacterium]